MNDIIEMVACAISGAPFPSVKSINKAKAAIAALADAPIDERACSYAFKLYNNEPAMIFEQAIKAYLNALKDLK